MSVGLIAPPGREGGGNEIQNRKSAPQGLTFPKGM